MEGMAIGHNLKKFTDERRMPIADTGELKKRCTRLAATSDKVYQLLAHSW
jgi:hypothetical protein